MLTDIDENVQKWTRVFSTRRWVNLVARTRGKKKEKKKACPLLDAFPSGQVSSPRLYRLMLELIDFKNLNNLFTNEKRFSLFLFFSKILALNVFDFGLKIFSLNCFVTKNVSQVCLDEIFRNWNVFALFSQTSLCYEIKKIWIDQ